MILAVSSRRGWVWITAPLSSSPSLSLRRPRVRRHSAASATVSTEDTVSSHQGGAASLHGVRRRRTRGGLPCHSETLHQVRERSATRTQVALVWSGRLLLATYPTNLQETSHRIHQWVRTPHLSPYTISLTIWRDNTIRLQYAVSEMGKCRAWIRMAVNECSLESYIGVICQDTSLGR